MYARPQLLFDLISKSRGFSVDAIRRGMGGRRSECLALPVLNLALLHFPYKVLLIHRYSIFKTRIINYHSKSSVYDRTTVNLENRFFRNLCFVTSSMDNCSRLDNSMDAFYRPLQSDSNRDPVNRVKLIKNAFIQYVKTCSWLWRFKKTMSIIECVLIHTDRLKYRPLDTPPAATYERTTVIFRHAKVRTIRDEHGRNPFH